MHGPMKESDGDFGDWKPSNSPETPCDNCGAVGQIRYRTWESSCGGYEDYKLKCFACGKTWWVEGADA